jgi:hypothetical protein
MIEFNTGDYYQALNNLNKTELRIALLSVQNHLRTEKQESITSIKKKLDKVGEKQKAKLIKPLTLNIKGKEIQFFVRRSSSYEVCLNEDREPNSSVKKNTISYLLFFSQEYEAALAYESKENTYQLIGRESGQFEIINTHIQKLGTYDVFYPRTYTDSKETSGVHSIGVAKLSFSPDEQSAEMVFHYLPKAHKRAYLKGTVHKKRENYYIELVDVDKSDDQTGPIRYYLSLYVAPEDHLRDYLSGVYATSDRKWNTPVCGMIHLLKTNNSDLYSSEYVDEAHSAEMRSYKNIPDHIYYSLFDVRFWVGQTKITDKSDFKYARESVELAKDYAGIYQAYAFREDNRVKLMKLKIEAKGTVTLYEKGRQSQGYIDYYGSLDNNNNKRLIIKFDYNSEHDYYRFSYMLMPDNHTKNIVGFEAGFNSKDQPTASPVYIEYSENPEQIVVEELKPVPEEYIAQKQSLTTLHQLFTNHTSSHASQSPPSPNRHSPPPISEAAPTEQPRLPLDGPYNAFFLNKIEESSRQKYPLPDQPLRLVQLPITVREGKMSAQYGSETIHGNAHSFDHVHRWTIQFHSPSLEANLIVALPVGYGSSSSNEFYYGLITQFHNGKEPEASALIIYRETDPVHHTYKNFERIDELRNLDARYPGLVSFLYGDWGRFVRMPSYERANKKVLDKLDDYRAVFFAAACYYGRQGKRDQCQNNLKRAYRHGFAADSFAGLSPADRDFPGSLARERQELKEALSNDLKNEEELIVQLWGSEITQ